MTGFSINEPYGSARNPMPFSVTGISPTSALMSGPDQTLRVFGKGFRPEFKIVINGVFRTTTFVSSTELATTIKPSNPVLPSGSWPVTVGIFQFRFAPPQMFTYIRAKEEASS